MPGSDTGTMRAWICTSYGGVEGLRLQQCRKPVPKAGEVLIRVRATTVSSADVRIRTMTLPRGFGALGRLMFGFRRPRQPILGTELAGTVEAVGSRVTSVRPGDEVIAFPGGKPGAHAEYVTMPEDGLIVPKPPGVPFEAAAALCFGGTTARHFLRKAGLNPGEKVLVIGASGAVGSAIVQLARHMGAIVTGVTSTPNIDVVRGIGAGEVIDYTTTDILGAARRYDIIADTVNATSFKACLPILEEGGRYLAIAGDLPAMFARPVGTKRSIAGPAAERLDDVRELARLAADGVFRPLIDAVFEFEDMPAAHARAESGRKRGNVVVTSGEA